jgi:hypothetical protein
MGQLDDLSQPVRCLYVLPDVRSGFSIPRHANGINGLALGVP